MTVSSKMQEFLEEKTVEDSIKNYLAYIMGTFCPDDDSLNSIVTDILLIVRKKLVI